MSQLSHTITAPVRNHTVEHRPWGRALLWLLFLGPFFFASYGYANWLASQTPVVSHIVFDWERHIPFIPWTILPYWSIDLLYGISLFICATRKELNRQILRLLTAQVVAVMFFILFPLEFTFSRTETDGIAGWLFDSLTSFDRPYNQAPSLHITLLVILWVQYLRHLPRRWHWLFHMVCLLIGVSVLTTYQHHFIDVPTGALLGWLCAWMWPLEGDSVFASAKLTTEPRRWRIACYYLAGVLMLVLSAFSLGGIWLWLLWPAVSLLLVALNYIYFGSAGFQKNADGKMSAAAKWLYFPYRVGAYINSRLWTLFQSKYVAIGDGVYLGRMPTRKDTRIAGFKAVVDMTAEFDKSRVGIQWHAFPSLDLLIPASAQLMTAAQRINQLAREGNVLVVCALGYSRSALAVVAWLLYTKRSFSVDDAITRVRAQRPGIVVSEAARLTLESFVEELKPNAGPATKNIRGQLC